MARLEYDWDPSKAVANFAKHRVSFADAMSVFLDPLALSRPDEDTGNHEERWITMGLNRDRVLLLVGIPTSN